MPPPTRLDDSLIKTKGSRFFELPHFIQLYLKEKSMMNGEELIKVKYQLL